MSTPFSPEMVVLCEARLAEITDADTKALTQFAQLRLAADGAPSSYGEDATQRAFELVLRGLETDRGGRRPRPVDMTDKPAFLNYMRGVISSVTYRMTRRPGGRLEYEALSEDIPAVEPEENSPAKQAEIMDLKAELFPRLRARAAPGLLATIDAWESVFVEGGRIPRLPQRSYVREVRELTQKVLQEMGEIR